MEIIINLEKKEDDIEIPITDADGFQMRSDGVLLNGKLHIWEEILFMSITNRGELRKMQAQKEDWRYECECGTPVKNEDDLCGRCTWLLDK